MRNTDATQIKVKKQLREQLKKLGRMQGITLEETTERAMSEYIENTSKKMIKNAVHIIKEGLEDANIQVLDQ